MEMKKLVAGKLRAVGYDRRERVMRIEFEDKSVLDYLNVGEDVWRRFTTHSSPWSFYRDNIEEEFGSRRGAARAESNRSALEDLFKAPDV